MTLRHHRDVIACTLITLGAVIWLGVIVSSWFEFKPIVILATGPVSTLLGTWTAAVVLDDLDISEATLSGGLAAVIGLGLRQLDERAAPALWMLGPCVLGMAVSALAACVAKRVHRPRPNWRPLAAGLLTCGLSVAALVFVVAAQADTTWRVAAPLIAMTLAGGVAYLLIPGLTASHIILGHCLILAIGGVGMSFIHTGAGVIGATLMGGIYGGILGAMSALLGFWGRMIARRPTLDVEAAPEARVVARN